MYPTTLNILDFSTLVPGPFATHLLQKHAGAQVEKIEDSEKPDPLSLLKPTTDGIGIGYSRINDHKNIVKTSIKGNLSATLSDNIKKSDVCLHNFKPNRAFKLGLSYEDVHAINPDLIYVSISGYNANHALAGKSAHDLNILSVSGYLDPILHEHTLSIPPILMADIFTSYHLATVLLSALFKGDKGKHLEISMFDALSEAFTLTTGTQQKTALAYKPMDNVMSGRYPCYHIYPCSDGFVAVAALEQPLWVDFCTHLSKPAWSDKQFEPSIIPEISSVLAQTDKKHWLASDLDFCVTPVLDAKEAALFSGIS